MVNTIIIFDIIHLLRIFYEMLHANVQHNLRSTCHICLLLHHGLTASSGSSSEQPLLVASWQISANVSSGQFLWPVPRLAPQRTAASRHCCHVISMFGHCVQVVHLCFAGTFREKPRYHALLALFSLDLPQTGKNDFCPMTS